MSKSITRTVRLDEHLDQAVQKRAKQEKVSPSFLVSRAVRRFIEWDLPGETIGLATVSSPVLNRLFDELDDNKCAELGRWAATEWFKPFAEYVFGELSLHTSVQVFRRMSRYVSRLAFDDTVDGTNHILVIRHSLGRKFSIYLGGLIEGVFRDQLGKEPRVERTDALCIVQIKSHDVTPLDSN